MYKLIFPRLVPCAGARMLDGQRADRGNSPVSRTASGRALNPNREPRPDG